MHVSWVALMLDVMFFVPKQTNFHSSDNVMSVEPAVLLLTNMAGSVGGCHSGGEIAVSSVDSASGLLDFILRVQVSHLSISRGLVPRWLAKFVFCWCFFFCRSRVVL